MDGVAVAVLLQHEYARPLGEIRVVLHEFGRAYAGDQVANKDSVRRELIITVLRDPDFTPGHKGDDLLQRVSHRNRLPTNRDDCKRALGVRLGTRHEIHERFSVMSRRTKTSRCRRGVCRA